MYGVFKNHISLKELEEYLLCRPNKKETSYRRLLCVYDFMKCSGELEKLES